jgi:hypothetical protein
VRAGDEPRFDVTRSTRLAASGLRSLHDVWSNQLKAVQSPHPPNSSVLAGRWRLRAEHEWQEKEKKSKLSFAATTAASSRR